MTKGDIYHRQKTKHINGETEILEEKIRILIRTARIIVTTSTRVYSLHYISLHISLVSPILSVSVLLLIYLRNILKYMYIDEASVGKGFANRIDSRFVPGVDA